MLDRIYSWLCCLRANKKRTGTRKFYDRNRILLACVHGEYKGNDFLPYADTGQWLSKEQIDSIVVVETMPDD